LGIILINKLTELSKQLAEIRKNDPEQIDIMNRAAQEQAPRFLLISQINRSTQDLQLLRMNQGDSFQATRIPGQPLLQPKDSMFLFAGPASYNSNFPINDGVVVTFDKSEHPEVIRHTIDSISRHPSLSRVTIVSLIVDYDQGDVRLGAHGKDRNYELEIWLLKQITRPDLIDERLLIIICSDSRVKPPTTPRGVPLAIQTLGGYIPPFTKNEDETMQLDSFFREWLSEDQSARQIVVVAHGAFSGEGASCGTGKASLNPYEFDDEYLSSVITRIAEHASIFESTPARTAEDRAQTIAKMTIQNLLTYPAVNDFLESYSNKNEFFQIVLMDTVTNILEEFKQ
jgi:carbonic anhydrase